MAARLTALLLALMVALPAWAQEARTFAEPGHGYTLTYPPTWERSQPGPYALVLRPPPEVAGGPVSVSVENVRQPDDAGLLEGVDLLAERYLTELGDHATQVEIHREAPFRWTFGDGAPLVGRQIVADFTRDGLPFRQWAVFLPSPCGPVVHVWLYTAPQSLFAEWRMAAEEILRSLRPATGR